MNLKKLDGYLRHQLSMGRKPYQCIYCRSWRHDREGIKVPATVCRERFCKLASLRQARESMVCFAIEHGLVKYSINSLLLKSVKGLRTCMTDDEIEAATCFSLNLIRRVKPAVPKEQRPELFTKYN